MSTDKLLTLETDQGYFLKSLIDYVSKQADRGQFIISSDGGSCQADNAEGDKPANIFVELLLDGSNLKIDCDETKEFVLGINFREFHNRLDYIKKKDGLKLSLGADNQKSLQINISNINVDKNNVSYLPLETFAPGGFKPPIYEDKDGKTLKPNCEVVASTFVKAIKMFKKSKIRNIRLYGFPKGILMIDSKENPQTGHIFGKVPDQFMEWLQKKVNANTAKEIVSGGSVSLIVHDEKEKKDELEEKYKPLACVELESTVLAKFEKVNSLAPTNCVRIFLYNNLPLKIASNVGALIGYVTSYVCPLKKVN
jgi:hypothetical protein